MRRTLTTSLTSGLLLLALAGCGREDQTQLQHGGASSPEVDLAGAAVLYVLIPLGIIALIAVLVLLPGMSRGNRYRPGRGWAAAPVWFAGPPDPAAAVETAEVAEIGRGGASGNW